MRDNELKNSRHSSFLVRRTSAELLTAKWMPTETDRFVLVKLVAGREMTDAVSVVSGTKDAAGDMARQPYDGAYCEI